MTPIVNGLKQTYGEQIDFQLLDASFGKGETYFNFYGLVGHPSYLLLAPDGAELWRAIGPLDKEKLEQEILASLQR